MKGKHSNLLQHNCELSGIYQKQQVFSEGEQTRILILLLCSSVRTVQSLGILTGAQIFSLTKEELRRVSPEEGTRVYSQIMVQRALLEVCPQFIS